MNTAKLTVLKDTFEEQFSIERFKKFTREFFNEPEMLPEGRRTGIWKEYLNHINSYYTVARYTDNDNNKLIVLAVELKKDSSIDRARSMQRNFIAKVLDENNMEAAIVAFYTENDPGWRLSLVRLDYSFKETGISLDLTPARRYSYLLGKKEPNITAQAQLLPIFENDRHNPTLDEIEEAFSVEKVTKEFYGLYKEKYFNLKEYLESDPAFIAESEKLGFEVGKFSEQFAKKLMGQLAFLYFLQKKGWLGVRIMPEDHTLTEAEFRKIYTEHDQAHRNVLDKVFKILKDKSRKLSPKELFNIDEHEAALLSDCFVGTDYDMPWGSGNRTFIREIFDFCNNKTNKNFFDDYLEPFFYEALNTKRKNQYFKTFNCKIPFFNGGLFEPLEGYHWQDVQFEIPNEIFSNKEQKGREADGILDIFDRFNFTINEDEPLEKEVAVDPEMLGKIFENLLDVSDRKSKGAFYTPREIVHYMCQESLINYLVNEANVPYEDMKQFILYGELIRDVDSRKDVGYGKEFTIKESIYNNIVKIDDALKNIKVADPAVGSGAFPLGMLNEIVKARNNITEYIIRKDKEGFFNRKFGEDFIRKRRAPYKMKWDTIKNSIFAVDIEPSAVDIAKLRLWLSVVVEQEINAENPEPHPLPNLDMNIHVGNSLIDEYEGIKLFDKSILSKKNDEVKDNACKKSETIQLSLLIDHTDEILKEMFALQDRYFDEDNEDKKKDIKAKIDHIRDELIRYKLQRDNNTDALIKYEKTLKSIEKPYFIWEMEFAKVFRDKGGFDIVIGNPPYVKEYTNSSIFQPLKSNQYYQGKMDFWYFFACEGIDLLNSNGIEAFIAPNNWITNSGASILRNKILNETEIKIFIDFGNYKIFDTSAIQTMVYILEKKTQIANSYPLSYSRLHADNFPRSLLSAFLYNDKSSDDYEKRLIKFCPSNYFNQYINFSNNTATLVLNRIKKSNNVFLTNKEIAQGIVAPQNNLNKANQKILGTEYSVGEGIFVLSNAEVDKLNIPQKEKKLIKPFYTTEQFQRYKSNPHNEFNIIYTKSNINSFINHYPVIKRHLDRFTSIITSDNKPYGLHRARDENFFIGEKIISVRKCSKPTFAYVDFDAYVSQTFNVIKSKRFKSKYLVAILNSRLIEFWLLNMGKMQGNNYQIDKEPLVNIPIAIPTAEMEWKLIDLVDKILSSNESINTYFEKEIDRIVYEIYGLTDMEIKIVEEAFVE